MAVRDRALVPQEHLTDLGTVAARSRFKVGQAVSGRVLHADAAARRITLTLKKALVSAKLPPFTSWEVRTCASAGQYCTVVCTILWVRKALMAPELPPFSSWDVRLGLARVGLTLAHPLHFAGQ